MAVDESPGAGRVLIALSDGPLVADPTWTRFDDESVGAQLRCHGFDSFAGRQSELDVTDTGTASVYFHDRAKELDDADLVGRQIMLQLYNPVADEWQPRWRGRIDEIQRTLADTPGVPFADVILSCVGVFDYLGRTRFLPGMMGDPGGPADVVFYEDERGDDRCTALLDDAGLDPDMYVVFTLNMFVNETLYDSDGDSILVGLRDVADAEFPGIANVYEDRYGRVAIHGRHARFDPEAVAGSASNWDFNSWEAATRADVTSGVAQISEFAYNIPLERVINSYLAWPRADENGIAFDRTNIPDLLATDPASISAYGYSGKDAPDLIVKQEYEASGGRTGAELCALTGQFYVQNYSEALKAVQRVSLRTIRPEDARAEATWDAMCRMDISDRLTLTIDEADLDGVAFFVDGISVACRPANPDYDHVTVTPNLTPAAYYGTDVFAT